MEREDDIIELHWIDSIRMSFEIFSLYGWYPKEGNVEQTVEGEANDVQAQEFKAQSNDTFSLPVVINLGVEGD